MKHNIGILGRLARLALAMAAVAAGIYAVIWINEWLGLAVVLLGLYLLYEAGVGWCALYATLGINTYRKRENARL